MSNILRQKKKSLALLICLALFFSNISFAQSEDSGVEQSETEDKKPEEIIPLDNTEKSCSDIDECFTCVENITCSFGDFMTRKCIDRKGDISEPQSLMTKLVSCNMSEILEKGNIAETPVCEVGSDTKKLTCQNLTLEINSAIKYEIKFFQIAIPDSKSFEEDQDLLGRIFIPEEIKDDLEFEYLISKPSEGEEESAQITVKDLNNVSLKGYVGMGILVKVTKPIDSPIRFDLYFESKTNQEKPIEGSEDPKEGESEKPNEGGTGEPEGQENLKEDGEGEFKARSGILGVYDKIVHKLDVVTNGYGMLLFFVIIAAILIIIIGLIICCCKKCKKKKNAEVKSNLQKTNKPKKKKKQVQEPESESYESDPSESRNIKAKKVKVKKNKRRAKYEEEDDDDYDDDE